MTQQSGSEVFTQEMSKHTSTKRLYQVKELFLHLLLVLVADGSQLLPLKRTVLSWQVLPHSRSYTLTFRRGQRDRGPIQRGEGSPPRLKGNPRLDLAPHPYSAASLPIGFSWEHSWNKLSPPGSRYQALLPGPNLQSGVPTLKISCTRMFIEVLFV